MKQFTMQSVLIFSLVAILALLSTGCLSLLYPQARESVVQPKYELTKDDVFSVGDVQSTDIAVMGAHLGSTLEEVIAKLGKPDIQTAVGTNAFNLEYRESLGMDNVGLLFHFENDKATRITVKVPFNDHLVGQTKVKHFKEEIYQIFGRPDKIQILSAFTIYYYYNQGIEVIMDGKVMNGFSLVYPAPELARENTE